MFALDTNYNYLGFNNAHVVEMKKVYSADIEIGQHIFSYMPRKDDQLKAEINYKRVLKGERFIEIQKYGEAGSRFWYELIFNPIISTSNQVTGFTVFVTNITERKLIEESLQESEEKYRILVENANDAIFVAQDGVIKFLNQKTEELTGYLEAELIKIPFVDLIHSDDKKLW